MRNPLRRLLAKLDRSPPAQPLLLDSAELQKQVEAVLAPAPPLKPKPRAGRVIKQTRRSEFNPNPTIHGGRIVKVMPRKLQKIKAAQEMVENDEIPQIED